jgi:hypothetical protein
MSNYSEHSTDYGKIISTIISVFKFYSGLKNLCGKSMYHTFLKLKQSGYTRFSDLF